MSVFVFNDRISRKLALMSSLSPPPSYPPTSNRKKGAKQFAWSKTLFLLAQTNCLLCRHYAPPPYIAIEVVSVLFTDINNLLLLLIFFIIISFSRTGKYRRTLTPMFRSLQWQSLTEVWGTLSISDTGVEWISILPEKDHTVWFFFNNLYLKVLSASKYHRKISKCQSFLWVWHLVIFRGEQLKKATLYMSKINLWN